MLLHQSVAGGEYCTTKGMGKDPLYGYTKQCICDPNVRGSNSVRYLRRLKSKKSGTSKQQSDWKLSPQVEEFLRSVLRYEYRLYSSAKQHLKHNLEQCKIVKPL